MTESFIRTDVMVKYGQRTLFDDTININIRDKICLIGPNGTGKTTLLEAIYNKSKELFPNMPIIYIKQDIVVEELNISILEYVLQANITMHAASKRYNELSDCQISEEETEEYNHIIEYLENNEWNNYKTKALKIINGLGIDDPNKSMKLLSGGWKIRVAIAKSLLVEPNLLLLDEPTNHLDLNGVIWLTNYLSMYKKALVVVTHMQHFVRNVATHTWLLKNYDGISQKLLKVRGNAEKVFETLEQMTTAQQKEYNKFSKKVKEMQNKSVSKKEVEEYKRVHCVIQPPVNVKTHFIFEECNDFGSRNIVSLNDVHFTYPDATKSIFKGINIGISCGSRYVIVGENGAGKTTLFNLCAGKLDPCKGEIHIERGSRISVYNQDIVSVLKLEITPFEYIKLLHPNMEDTECRAHLGRIGIKKAEGIDPIKIKIEELSGGYKARLAFLRMILEKPSVILLDEPTNHLDMDTINFLIDSLNEFNGGIMIITHDVDFIERLDDHIILEVDKTRLFKRSDINEYIQSR